MIEVLFELNGIEQKEMACFDNLQEMQDFIKYYQNEILGAYPEAKNIRLGQCFIGIAEL